MALVIELNIALCKFIDAFIQTDTNVADLTSVANIIENVKTAKTIIQVSRVIDNPKIVSVVAPVVDVLLSVVVNKLLFSLVIVWKKCSSTLTLNKY